MNQAVRVKLPKVAHAKPAMISTVAVTLKKDGQLYFNGKKTDYRELREKITQRLAEQEQLNEQEPEKKHKLQAIIAADAEVPHGDVMHLVDVVKDVGVKEFAFNIKKVDEVPPP
jgi:biopolymer transport protein ExbD